MSFTPEQSRRLADASWRILEDADLIAVNKELEVVGLSLRVTFSAEVPPTVTIVGELHTVEA